MKEHKKHIVGVDVGGSHISSAAIDVATFEILPASHYSAELDHRMEKEEILQKWAGVINQSLSHLNAENCLGIGFAMPGPFDYPEGVAKFQGNDKYENLYNVPVRRELQELIKFPELELHFFNDASSFGVGAQIHLHSEVKRAVGLTLGTGFGSVFLKEGYPLLDAKDIPENGSLWSLSFRDSIADDYFGTRWFLKKFENITDRQVKGVKEIIDTGHPAIGEIFTEFAENLGEFILPHLQRFQAEELLLGGNIVRSHPYFLPHLEAIFREQGFNLKVQTLVETECCNILGASKLMLSNYWGNRKKLDYFF